MTDAIGETIKLDDYVKAYLAIRAQRENLKRDYDLADSELKAEIAKLDEVLLAECNNISAAIIKTLRENFVCGDWDGLKEFIMEKDLIELLQQRLHSGNLKEYLITHGADGLPPGISSIREYSIVVKKPSKT